MQRLCWAFILLLTLFLQVVPGSAAERVLLRAAGQAGATTQGGAALGGSATVKGLRATALNTGTVKVIVGLRVPFAPAPSLGQAEAQQQVREIATASATLRRRYDAAIARNPDSFRSYSSIPFIALEVTPAELDRLATDPDVISITENKLLRLNLSKSAPLIRAPEAWADGYTGQGQTIAIIDSGVDSSHPILGGRVVSEACYTLGQCPGNKNSSTASGSGAPCAGSEECSHGTHVAGIAAGFGSTSFSGIAPAAKLISIKVFTVIGGQAAAFLSDINAGLDRVYQLSGYYHIAAVNMSLGGNDAIDTTCDDDTPSTTALINQLRAAGIATVIASGNNGYSNAINFPACISTAISVGSVSTSDWGTCATSGITPASTAADKVACYSNAYQDLSLLAPGSPITSSIPGNRYETWHGTSMAAPHVAGAIAVLRQKAPGASVDDILDALRDTGKKVTDYRNPSIITPRIDVKAALDAVDANAVRIAIQLRINGNGHGEVSLTSANMTQSCAENCSIALRPGRVVTLTATPQANSFFSGWGGPCSDVTSCTIVMDQAKTVFAEFYTLSSGRPTPISITKTGGGGGSIDFVADGQTMTCTGSCVRYYGKNSTVKLTALPAYGAALTSWFGACSGKKATCVVKLSKAKSVGANFEMLPVRSLTYTRAGAAGTVQIISAGRNITCDNNCSNDFPSGTPISLTAIPAAGKTFGGWKGACKGLKTTCSFTIKSSASVTATFK